MTSASMQRRVAVGAPCFADGMASWSHVVADSPDLATRVQERFEASRHKTMATLRADGSPRISGTETRFVGGELTFGSMPGARKGADLHRDPRVALHSATVDPVEGQEALWPGEAKLAGSAVPSAPLDGPPGDYFRLDITEVVLTRLNQSGTALMIQSWHPGRGTTVAERT